MPPWLSAASFPTALPGSWHSLALLWMLAAVCHPPCHLPLAIPLSRGLLPVLPKLTVPNTTLTLCHPCLASRMKLMFRSITQEVLYCLTFPPPLSSSPRLLLLPSTGEELPPVPGRFQAWPHCALWLPLCRHLECPLPTTPPVMPLLLFLCSSSQVTSWQLSQLWLPPSLNLPAKPTPLRSGVSLAPGTHLLGN